MLGLPSVSLAWCREIAIPTNFCIRHTDNVVQVLFTQKAVVGQEEEEENNQEGGTAGAERET